MHEPKKLNHWKSFLVTSAAWPNGLERRFYGDHNESKGRGSTPTFDMLLCSRIRYFTIFVAAWWLEQAANSTKDKKRNLRKVNSQASEDNLIWHIATQLAFSWIEDKNRKLIQKSFLFLVIFYDIQRFGKSIQWKCRSLDGFIFYSKQSRNKATVQLITVINYIINV